MEKFIKPYSRTQVVYQFDDVTGDQIQCIFIYNVNKT